MAYSMGMVWANGTGGLLDAGNAALGTGGPLTKTTAAIKDMEDAETVARLSLVGVKAVQIYPLVSAVSSGSGTTAAQMMVHVGNGMGELGMPSYSATTADIMMHKVAEIDAATVSSGDVSAANTKHHEPNSGVDFFTCTGAGDNIALGASNTWLPYVSAQQANISTSTYADPTDLEFADNNNGNMMFLPMGHWQELFLVFYRGSLGATSRFNALVHRVYD